MLANNLTLDDEDAVQEELKALQEEAVRDLSISASILYPFCYQRLEESHKTAAALPSVPDSQLETREGTEAFQFSLLLWAIVLTGLTSRGSRGCRVGTRTRAERTRTCTRRRINPGVDYFGIYLDLYIYLPDDSYNPSIGLAVRIHIEGGRATLTTIQDNTSTELPKPRNLKNRQSPTSASSPPQAAHPHPRLPKLASSNSNTSRHPLRRLYYHSTPVRP